jgi:hypothetical protein
MTVQPGVLFLAVAAGILVVWTLSSFLYRVAGTWERVLSAEDREAGVRAETITLAQLGPLVTGRRDVPGGHQELSGLLVGRRLRLTRRDHGTKSLVALGFPEPVAQRLDGDVMARLELELRDGVLLQGDFFPKKVEFTHQPPRITRSFFLAAQPRRYRRAETVLVRSQAVVERGDGA